MLIPGIKSCLTLWFPKKSPDLMWIHQILVRITGFRTWVHIFLAALHFWHYCFFRFCDELASLFGPPLLYQIFITPVELCITAFQVSKVIYYLKREIP